jgi:hypothetical protein
LTGFPSQIPPVSVCTAWFSLVFVHPDTGGILGQTGCHFLISRMPPLADRTLGLRKVIDGVIDGVIDIEKW